ncbi:metallophosphoesterase [Aquimarina sp. D1M17]|uniref:metallophosphoesterase family protein n=1 Tax=Aquimarina acroporae TaxID=2937283 RepID=UPI0020C11EBB|nr:metallophosphoesterase [Aquimarina acroporae]MCK8520477.1 metallophosphoesterase [Aquimarina acroporae]
MIQRIAHITDLHLDEEFPFRNQTSARNRFDTVLKDIEQEQINHIICTGDIGENNGIEYFFTQLKKKKLLITLGNHDQFSDICTYHPLQGNHNTKKTYWSHSTQFFKFMYLDSSSGAIDKEQLDWLKKEISSPKPILIFVHHPIIGLNLKVDEIGKLKNRREVTEILTRATTKISIYCGHYHMKSFQVYKNIEQFITPAIAFQIKKNIGKIEIDTNISGYRIIQINETEVTSKVKFLHHAN